MGIVTGYKIAEYLARLIIYMCRCALKNGQN